MLTIPAKNASFTLLKTVLNFKFQIIKTFGSWKENEVAGQVASYFFLFQAPAAGSNPAGPIS